MAKSKNHTAHNQTRKNHRNGEFASVSVRAWFTSAMSTVERPLWCFRVVPTTNVAGVCCYVALRFCRYQEANAPAIPFHQGC